MSKKRVTQADVAKKAGVSQTAVSQILGAQGNEVNFRLNTRERVLKAAKELGYVPSIIARGLRTSQTMTIGVVVSFLTDELALRITNGIQDVATDRGYGILIGDTNQEARREKRVLDRFRQYAVDGLIFVDSWSDPVIYLEDETYPPMIFAQLRQMNVEHNCVSKNDVQGGYQVTRHLLKLGYRRVALIRGPKKWASATQRIEGYRQALEEYGVSYNDMLIEYGDWEILGGREVTHQILHRCPEVDAIFASNDLMAAGAIQAALSHGLSIPHDLAVVGYDDRLLAQALSPQLTSFAIPLHSIGENAAYLLIDQLLKKQERYVPSINVSGHLAVRASCGARLGLG